MADNRHLSPTHRSEVSSENSLPEVEDLDRAEQWDGTASDRDEPSRFSSSRIPRPVASQSVDKPARLLHVADPGGLVERAVTESTIPLHGSVEQTPVESLDRSKTDIDRTPRYKYGQFNNYEEMLAAMDDADPFNGAPPPPREAKEAREKSFTRPPQKKRITGTSRDVGNSSDNSQSKKTRRKTTKPPPERVPEEQEDMNGTNTIAMHENPVYEGVVSGNGKTRHRGASQKQVTDKGGVPGGRQNKKTESKQRPISASSTGTYTVGLECSDSQTKLIKEDKQTELDAGMITSRSMPGRTIQKVQVDYRAHQDTDRNHHDPPQHYTRNLPGMTLQAESRPDSSNGDHQGHIFYGAYNQADSGYIGPSPHSKFMGLTARQYVNAIRDYVRNNIQHRECCMYIRDPRKDEPYCQCGRDYEWHHEQNLPVAENKREKWRSEVHSKLIPANSYGMIRFQGFGQEAQHGAPYVRVDHTADLEKVWTLLDKYWLMPPPKLLISVTGGAKRFFMKSRLMASFKRGLVNAATTTGAWIITGGTRTGVMEFVGEAVRDHMLTSGSSKQKVVALGIATWGIVDNKDALDDEEISLKPGNGLFPADYNAEELSPKSAKGVSSLDPNHTHFILVDNGTEKTFGAEIELRVRLEQYISEKMETGVTKSQSVHVPVVLLVLEGGENTLETASQSVWQNTPVVVIQGSGRAADFIAYAYRETKPKDGNDDKPLFSSGFDDELLSRAGYMFDWSREKDPNVKKKKIRKCVDRVKRLLEKRRLVTVFHLDDVDTTNEIDQAILYALLKANKANAQSQLNLALAWNRCDIARQEIFTMENRSQWQKVNLYEAMFTALVQDRIDFVQLFLDCGVDLKRFLSKLVLRELFDDVIHDRYGGPSKDLLLHLLQQTQASCITNCCNNEPWSEDSPYLLQHVGSVINHLLGDQRPNFYSGDKYLVPNRSDQETHSESNNYSSPAKHANNNMGFQGELTTRSFGNQTMRKRKSRIARYTAEFNQPEKDLFVWAVLLNRKDLALLFWRNGKDHIAAALVGCCLLKSLSAEAEAEEETDLSQALLANAMEFEEIAVGLLNECYQRDKVMAHKLLTREQEEWGGNTLFSLAEEGECMDFMGHSCCQTRLNKIWKGNMALYTSTWKIVSSLIFPFLIPTIKFSGSDFGGDVFTPTVIQNQDANNQVVPKDSKFLQSPVRKKVSRREKLKKKLYSVNLCGCGLDNSINFFQALFFYHTAPVVKFYYHTMSYLVFLGLFSFFALTNLHPANSPMGVSVYEYIVWGWAVSLMIEELRQVLSKTSGSIQTTVAGYFSSVWNRFDMAVYILLIISIILRYTLPDKDFVWARMFYAVTLCLFFLRFLYTFFVEKNIGPKVIMIRRMLTDLMFFVLILLVFVFAYGVASQVLRYPNAALSWDILKNVVFQPYWNIYGELFLEDMEGEVPDCTTNDTLHAMDPEANPRCPEKSWLAMVLFAIYMILTNILLLNLLIAMFSYTFERVQENSEQVWRFYRHGLVYEYFDKPTLAPPLILLSHIWRVFKFIYRKCCRKGEYFNTHFYQKLATDENIKLTAFERAAMENYQINKHLISREHIDAKVTSAGERIELVISDLEQIKESVLGNNQLPGESSLDTSSTTTAASPNAVELLPSARNEMREDISVMHGRISGLEDQLQSQQDTLGRVLYLLEELTAGGARTRGRFLPTPPQPHIEIQDFGGGSHS